VFGRLRQLVTGTCKKVLFSESGDSLMLK
jgi:hypothetical protein